jgi:hypothetical protein
MPQVRAISPRPTRHPYAAASYGQSMTNALCFRLRVGSAETPQSWLSSAVFYPGYRLGVMLAPHLAA